MHVAEGFSHHSVACHWMAQHRPIGAGNIAAPDGLVPKPVQRDFIPGLGELPDRSIVAPVKRLLDEFSAALRPSGERHALFMQVMVAGAFGAMSTELDQKTTNLGVRKAGADDRAMHAGMHIPDRRALLRVQTQLIRANRRRRRRDTRWKRSFWRVCHSEWQSA